VGKLTFDHIQTEAGFFGMEKLGTLTVGRQATFF